MELVQGVPIARFCDDNQLTVRERLELFVPVCQAVQHAHQKGIIHRDIKPSNVLVTRHEGKPFPKVIDFGIAKAIEQPLTERWLETQVGQPIGTLKYMSPEQTGLSGLVVDTRTDVYSLGVLLYELLTGTTPLVQGRNADPQANVLHLITDYEPPRPSSYVARSAKDLAEVATQRRTEPGKLAQMLRGDLDWITAKALDKDRNQRYETAVGLARDVQRHLNDEPVEACPPSTGYRLGKFALKHRTLLAVAAGFATMLLLGVVGLAIGLVVVNEARLQEEAAKQRAEREQQRTHQALDTTDAMMEGMIRKGIALNPAEKDIMRRRVRGSSAFPERPWRCRGNAAHGGGNAIPPGQLCHAAGQTERGGDRIPECHSTP